MNKEEIKHLQQSYYDLHEKYNKQKEVIDKIKEYIWSTKYEWGDLEEDNEDFDIDPQKILELLEEIE